jgi:hypothetical protein
VIQTAAIFYLSSLFFILFLFLHRCTSATDPPFGKRYTSPVVNSTSGDESARSAFFLRLFARHAVNYELLCLAYFSTLGAAGMNQNLL